MAARDSDNIKRNISPAQAMRILGESGTQISEKEAEIVLEFLYILGKLTVNQYIKGNSPEGET